MGPRVVEQLADVIFVENPVTVFSRLAGDNWSVAANADLSRIVAASETTNQVAVSTNSGDSFSVDTTSLPAGYATRDVLVVTDNIALLGGIGNFIYRTANFGGSWTQIAAPGSHNWGSFAMTDDTNKIIASSADASYLSTDQGQTWAVRTNNSPAAQAVNAMCGSADFSVIYCWDFTTATVISKSTDFGQTWTPLASQPTVISFWQGMHVSSDGQTICLSGFGGDLVRSTDGGSSWNNVLTTGVLNVFNRRTPGTTGSNIVVSGNYKLFKSHDSGATWATDTALDPYWVGNYTSPYFVCISTNGVGVVTGTEYSNQQILIRR